MAGLKIMPDYTEDTVATVLDSFLAVAAFPRRRFSIELFSKDEERWLGADGVVSGAVAGFKPFYMQFKRPHGYPGRSRSRFVVERRALGLETAPLTLFFELLPKKPQHRDLQHNVLFRLRRRCRRLGSDAVYVCPLFLHRDAYRRFLHRSALLAWIRWWRGVPWAVGQVRVRHGGGLGLFDGIPLLRGHATIPPHASVQTHSHAYSFSDRGEDICFHSPERTSGEAATLDRWMSEIVAGAGDGRGMISPEAATEALRSLVSGDSGEDRLDVPSSLLQEPSGIAGWQRFGSHLATAYDIQQYAVVQWRHHSDRPQAGVPVTT